MGFVQTSDNASVEMLPGITRRLISAGERAMAVRIGLAKGSNVPAHTHPHEQIGFVLSGRLSMTIEGESKVLEAGDAYAIAPSAPHSAEAYEDSVVVDVFSPVRQEYL